MAPGRHAMTAAEGASHATTLQPSIAPRQSVRAPHPRAFWWAAGAIVVLTAAALWHDWTEKKDYQSRQVEYIAQLRSSQVGTWLDDRKAVGNFINTSKLWADQLHHWQKNGDIEERDRLLGRM